jgi:allantoinase
MGEPFDLVIKNARIVRPNKTSVDCLDIAVKDGKIDRIAPDIRAEQGKEIFDARNYLAFPGCVDAHMHVGIYQPLAQDAVSESKAAAMGGVTSSLNYMRTGQYYLNRGGPYRTFMPEVFKQSDGRFWVDYGYHIAPIEAQHIDEMEHLAVDHGVTSFKIFMFYGGYGLHGRSNAQNDFLMIGPEERYDIAHFEFIMRSARRLMTQHPSLRITSASACTASSRRSSTPTPRSSSARASSPGCMPTAPPALRTPRGWRSGSRPISPMKRIASTSTCCT